MATLDPSAIRQRIAAAIDTALSASGYRESRSAPPLFPDGPAAQDTRIMQHKGYAVYLSTTAPVRDGRQKTAVGDWSSTGVHVAHGYHIRGGSAVADYDAALASEKALVAAAVGATANPDLRVRFGGVSRRAVTADGTLFVGRIDLTVHHFMPIA